MVIFGVFPISYVKIWGNFNILVPCGCNLITVSQRGLCGEYLRFPIVRPMGLSVFLGEGRSPATCRSENYLA